MDISDILKVIILNLRAKDHETALKEMTGRLLPFKPGQKALSDLKDHESMEGVLAGSGAAVFHCLSQDVQDASMAVAVSRKYIPHPKKKRPVRIFFLIVSPIKESGTHLQLLSKLEGLLLDRAFIHAVLNARSEQDIRRVLKKAEGVARSLYIPLGREEVFSELETSGDGLTEEEASRRLALAGPNTLKRIEKGALLKDLFYNLFLNLFAVLLWAGGFMAFLAGMPQLGWAIFLVVVINALFSFWQEYRAESAVEALKKLLPKKVRVIRGGREKELPAEALVPGDLIRLFEGDSIPADGRLIEAQEMRVDNSALTGESKPVYKISEPLPDGKSFIWTEVPNLVFAGTAVFSGSGSIIVTATGMNTEIGRVAYLTQAIKTEPSPLQKELARITKTVTLISVMLGALFFFLGYGVAGLGFAESFIFAIGIIVANVPEGLLPTVSLSLAMGVQRMAGKNAIVKRLSAVETLGSATVICTDKTGTLTTNQMCVGKLFVNNRLIEVSGAGYGPEGGFFIDNRPVDKKGLEAHGALRLLEAAALCNNASLRPPSKDSPFWTISGDPTEGALLTAAAKAGVDLERLNKDLPRIAHLPFERIRKRMSTVHLAGKAGAAAFVKGAPNEVLRLCTGISLGEKTSALTEEDKKKILEVNDRMASEGLRILAVAFREMEKKGSYLAHEVEKDLVFAGLAAMLDPPRPEVEKAVEQCHSAGIKVVMVTGDYGLTARAIAEKTGFSRDARLISGEELKGMSHGELREAVKKGEVIFARVEPQDKLRVVSALQDNGEIVAVTGDGVNDAPALKKADIGIAMGLRGSDVARESAEIILADDNFASIVDAVREGRAVYANIKKFVTYIFSSNVAEAVPFICFVIFKIPLPLTVLQVLAVDLGTDVLPALGLGVEPPENGVMNQPPRPKAKRLLDLKTLSRAYLFLGPIEAALSMSGFFFVYWINGWAPGGPMEASGALYLTATTMSFAGIVAGQAGNVFACRAERQSISSVGFLRNKLVLAGIAAEVLLLIALMHIPVLRRTFGFYPLGWKEWSLLLAFPAAILLADEARKAFLRRRARITRG